MILFMFFAQFYGVLQLSWLGSLTRTVRWRLLLLALLAGVAVVMPVTLLLELGGARLYGLVTDQAFVIALRDNSYTIDPFLEEGLKILPLIVACMIPAIRRQLSLVDLVLLGAALGSGFGLAEAFFNFNSSIDQASYIREGDIWAFAGSIFAFVAIPGVGRTLISWLPAGASIMDPSDVVTYGALQVNSHLVWSALVGLGLGLLLRLRPRWRWVGLLPIVLMGMAHAAQNVPGSVSPGELEQNMALSTFTTVFTWINTLNWLFPLIALGVATWLDMRVIRGALADVPDLLFPAERQSRFGLWSVAFRLRSKPWSTGLLWQLVLRRRAFALHKARTPRDFATLKPIHDGLAAIVKTLEGNPVVAPPRFIAVLTGRVKLSWGELGRKMLKLLTFQRVFLLLFSVPVILALGIGEIPDDAKRMREFLAGPVVYQLLLAFLIVGAVWQGIWLVREGVPRLVQMRKSNNGLLIMVSLLAVLMTIGAIGFSSAPFLSLLSGQEPLQKAFKLYFNGGEASSNASGYDISVLALLAYLAAGFAAGAVVGWVVSTLAESAPILLGNPIAVGIAIALIAGVIYVGGSNEIQSLLTHTGGDNSGGKSEPPGGGKSEPPGNLYEKWQS